MDMEEVFAIQRRLTRATVVLVLVVKTTSVMAAMALVVAFTPVAQALAATPGAAEPSAQAATPAPPLPMPPTRLIPQPEGTPLPPQDPTIADTWPPEFKQLIDNMITLFPKNMVDPAPNVEEVQRRMGITLVEQQLENFWDRRTWHKRFEVSGTRYVDPTEHYFSQVFRSFYGISSLQAENGERIQTLRLEIAPKLSGFCLNPYDLAVYTGWSFVNADTSPHANVRYWPPAYVWGMFAWSNTGRYGGPGSSIAIGIDKDESTQKTIRVGCVYSLTVFGRFPKEE
jgi:hypothetical protein